MELMFTIEAVGFLCGAATAVAMLTQILKKRVCLDPRCIALLVSILLVVGWQAVTGEFVIIEDGLLSVLTAGLVCCGAIGESQVCKGAYRYVQKKGDQEYGC